MNEIQKQIVKILKNKQDVAMSELVDMFGFSRAYLNRVINKLIQDELIVRIGQTNRVRYLLNTEAVLSRQKIISKSSYANNNLDEYVVFKDLVKKNTNIFSDLNKNVYNIIEFSFSEMLNNAIEHSKTKTITVIFSKISNKISFSVRDHGVGIFNHIIQKQKLEDKYEAIQDLLKGKLTTDPKRHSGQGIFFTSKIADKMSILSQKKALIVDNEIDDVFIKDENVSKGTEILFEVSLNSKKELVDVFDEFSNKDFKFDTTNIKVKLYQYSDSLISRSQARRILVGLDDFDSIILDFNKVETVGQGFADEIFRVYLTKYPKKKIKYINYNKDIEFMIKRAL